MEKITIHSEYITLGQFLKLAECISSGGQAKFFVQENIIHVDGSLENRRGRKLYPNMIIDIEGHGQFQVIHS